MARRKSGKDRQGDLFGGGRPQVGGTRARRSKSHKSAPRAGRELAVGHDFRIGIEVAVASPMNLLSYGWPAALGDEPSVGTRVTVPLRGRLVVGVIWRVTPVSEMGIAAGRLRPAAALLDDAPLWSADLMTTLEFVGRYYHVPLGQVVRVALPAPLRRTGFADDDDPVRMEWMVSAIDEVAWPVDLRKPERRVLEKVAAGRELPSRHLRRRIDPLTGQTRSVSVPQTLLVDLDQRGLLRLWQRRVMRDPLGLRLPVEPDKPPTPTEEQKAALQDLLASLHEGQGGAFVLRGVTGSGKTEIYLRLIAEALQIDADGDPEQSRSGAIVLVPEIALTPQLVSRFRARFGDQIAVLHSAMSDGERFDQYTRIRSGIARIVIGPRSALFAPLPRLAVIVLDECHDASFKQQSGVRYHARDVALVLARNTRAICVLGSATPGCEEMALVGAGHARGIDLHHRVGDRSLPKSRRVDLRTAERVADPDTGRPSLLSTELVTAIERTVRDGNQTIILHNRRGFASSSICLGCGGAVECPECAVTMTLHQRAGRLRCHYCARSVDVDQPCGTCGGSNMVSVGSGTERIEHTLRHHIDRLRIARFDRDTATGKRLLDILERFRCRQIDVLVGTQMLAKGHDFPAVTLVGVVLAEQGLRIPDFRASERTFQLLTQVAGRAGRGDQPGQVIVQTYAPEHPAIVAALSHDHASFVGDELLQRERTGYPPYSHLMLIESRSKQPAPAHDVLKALVSELRGWGVEVRGPVPAGLSRLRGVFRFHALVRGQDRRVLHQALARLRRERLPTISSQVHVSIDIDPTDFM